MQADGAANTTAVALPCVSFPWQPVKAEEKKSADREKGREKSLSKLGYQLCELSGIFTKVTLSPTASDQSRRSHFE